MRELLGWRRMIGLLGAGLLVSLAACQSPGSQRIIGPDGSPMAHVHCGAEQGLCFRLAGELCPGGYEMKPVLRASDGNFLVRCRSPHSPAAVACAPAVAPVTAVAPNAVTTRTPGLMDPWPPSAEPAPAAYPWPSPQTSAAARSQPKVPATQGDVDVGY